MTNKQHTYNDRITINPAVMDGKPAVRGIRIPVERVVAHLLYNPDLNDLFAADPDLTIDDVKVYLQYGHHAVEEKRTGTPSPQG